jgi:hypothetical protein
VQKARTKGKATAGGLNSGGFSGCGSLTADLLASAKSRTKSTYGLYGGRPARNRRPRNNSRSCDLIGPEHRHARRFQAALSDSPETLKARLLFVRAEAPAENERSPPVGHCNVGDSIRRRDVGGRAVVYRK